MFAIWLEPVELIAIDRDQRLVLAAPEATAGVDEQAIQPGDRGQRFRDRP